MNMKNFRKIMLLVLVAVIAGCSSDDPENKYSESEQNYTLVKELANAPIQIIEKGDLPKWLSDLIDGLKPDNMRTVAVYQGKWKGEDVYYVHDDFFSSIGLAIFRSDGKHIDGSENDSNEFWKSATDWKCIYLSKFKISDN